MTGEMPRPVRIGIVWCLGRGDVTFDKTGRELSLVLELGLA